MKATISKTKRIIKFDNSLNEINLNLKRLELDLFFMLITQVTESEDKDFFEYSFRNWNIFIILIN